MDRDSLLCKKSKSFSLRIIKLFAFLTKEKKEFIISKQIFRSGTSIGANIREAIRAQSSADFVSKLYISLKEAEETEYWLELLWESKILDEHKDEYDSLYSDCDELIKLLVASIKKVQSKTSES